MQDNYYYLCAVEPHISQQRLEGYEAQEGFALEFVPPQKAISENRGVDHGERDRVMIERDSRVLALLIDEGYLRRNGERQPENDIIRKKR